MNSWCCQGLLLGDSSKYILEQSWTKISDRTKDLSASLRSRSTTWKASSKRRARHTLWQNQWVTMEHIGGKINSLWHEAVVAKFVSNNALQLWIHINWNSCLGMDSIQYKGRIPEKKNCFSFAFFPNYLPPIPSIWTTCTTFFRCRNSRFERQFRTKSTICTIYQKPW